MLKNFRRVSIITALIFSLIFSAAALAEVNGVVRFPVDLSYLADNPPNENLTRSSKFLLKAEVGDETLPESYDLRNVGGESYVTSVKDQGDYGWCWAFSAIGAMESNYLMNGGEALDLSEMHLAWFTFKNQTKSKAFKNLSSASLSTIKTQGGNSFYPAAIYGRLDGPVLESEVPFGSTAPSATTPDSYTRRLRLRDVYYLSFTNNNVNDSDEARNIIKRRIMQTGAVLANYNNNQYEYYKASDGSTSFYTDGTEITHAVQIIGWDDNYSKSNFKTQPSIDGAWLIKNSWGDTWWNGSQTVGDNGCFWMSYEQFLDEGSAYIVEDANDDMKAYYLDALGWTITTSYSITDNNRVYTANVFKSERDYEFLTEVGFYTPDNNISYDIKIYKGMSAMPTSTPVPVSGTAASTQTGTMPFAGYHTVTLNNPVALTNGEYFSVVITMSGNKIPFEAVNVNMSPNATIEKGSFYAYTNGTYTPAWQAATDRNSCVRAFTQKDTAPNVPPEITSTYPPDAVLSADYYYKLTAKGSTPLTWTTSGSVPDGLSINASTGELTGTPTTLGNYTFTVTVSNDYGINSENYTMNVIELPTITTTEFEGYAGYAFSGTLKLSASMDATWSVTAGKLPKGLSLNASTGVIYGKPSSAATTTVTFTASTAIGSVWSNVKLIVNSKPTKPKITLSKLASGKIGMEYSKKITFSGTEPVKFSIEGQPTGLFIDEDTGEISGTPAAAGNFIIKVTASNIYTELNKVTVTKNVKLVIEAITPEINSPSDMPLLIVGEEYEGYTFTASGTETITWSASGLPKGMTLLESGDLSGKPTKAGNFKVNIKASNFSGKDSLKVPLTVYEKPSITTARLADATTGKKYNARIIAKGTGPISWDIPELPDTLKITLAKNGEQAIITGTPTAAGYYELHVTASNDVGIGEKTIGFNVKGVAPKIKASVSKAKVGSQYSASLSATGTLPIEIAYTILDADKTKYGIDSLEDLGLVFTPDPETGTATITGTPTRSIKSLPIYLSASNSVSATPVSKKISMTVTGTKPKFDSSMSGSVTQAVGSSINIPVSLSAGSPTVTFSINDIGELEISRTDDLNATITGTAPTKAGKYTLKVTAANADGKATKKITLITTAEDAGEASDAPKDVSDTQEKSAEPEKSEEPTSENESSVINSPVVNFGTERGISSIRAVDADALDGYKIAAVLPELTVSESNMYDFTIELAPEISSGDKLFWFAFPQNREKSDDDDIAEFYDTEGNEITTTPESHEILISVWLNSGDVYAPVIAVKELE